MPLENQTPERYRAELLQSQRILRKEYPLGADPVVIPFLGDHFQLLSTRGASGLSGVLAGRGVTVQFDEMDSFVMYPGESISGVSFRTVTLTKIENGSTHASICLSKMTNGQTPKINFDRDPELVPKIRTTVPSAMVIRPDFGSFTAHNPSALVGGFTEIFSDASNLVESVECEFQLCADVNDENYFQDAATAAGSGYDENFDFATAVNDLLADIATYETLLRSSVVSPCSASEAPFQLGVRLIQSSGGGLPDGSWLPDLAGKLAKFQAPANFDTSTYGSSFCMCGESYKFSGHENIQMFIPAALAKLMQDRRLSVNVNVRVTYAS